MARPKKPEPRQPLKRSERILLAALAAYLRDVQANRGEVATVRVPLGWVLSRFHNSRATAPRDLRAVLGLGSRASCYNAATSIWGEWADAFEGSYPPGTMYEANLAELARAAKRLAYLEGLKALVDHEGSIN